MPKQVDASAPEASETAEKTAEKAQGDGAFLHLDDFLNALEASERKVESLAAFAKIKKAENAVKKTWEAWLVDFRHFENSIPQ